MLQCNFGGGTAGSTVPLPCWFRVNFSLLVKHHDGNVILVLKHAPQACLVKGIRGFNEDC